MKVKGKHTNEMFDSLFVCSLLKIRDIYDTQKNGESQDFKMVLVSPSGTQAFTQLLRQKVSKH